MNDKADAIRQRVLGIDVARGVALLGIFFVNAHFFGQPFGTLFQGYAPVNESWLGVFSYWFTAVFCSGKFYPLFSILFGAGLAMMYQSAQQRGGSFEWNCLRRIFLLGCIGLVHVVFLWFGDILLIYASIAVLMIVMARFRAKTLLIIGCSLYGFSLLLMVPTIVVLMFVGANVDQQVVAKPMPDRETEIEQYLAIFPDWNQTEPFDSRLIELERKIMSEGPFAAAVVVRLVNYAFSVGFVVLIMFWMIFPCFCWGAAMMKGGFFHGEHRPWRRRFTMLGWSIGLPLAACAAWTSTNTDSPSTMFLGTMALTIGGPLIALMYLSLILDWADSGRGRQVAHWLANMGRMALTCYLLESLLMSAVMMHWGLGRFGNNTWGERFLWVIGIYLIILLFANLWMTRFQQGPLEFVWRRFTYWGKQPAVLPESN